MATLNSPEERLKRLQAKGMGEGIAAQNLSKNTPILPAQSVPTLTPIAGIPPKVAPIATPTPTASPIVKKGVDRQAEADYLEAKNFTGSDLAGNNAKIIAEYEAKNLQPFNEATTGQDTQFRQTYRQALNAPATPTTPVSPTGLVGAELQAYNELTPQERKTYDSLVTQGFKAQLDYLQKVKATQEYNKTQESLRLQQQGNANQVGDIQSAQSLAAGAKSVANLKQNLGYLGTGGAPGVSSVKLDAISNQTALADKTYANMAEVDRLTKANRALGDQGQADQFARQMVILQDDLDSKVNKTLQNAFNAVSAADMKGQLDTIPEIEAFQQQLYAQLDGDLSSIMDTNIEARKFLIDRYDRLATEQKEFIQNENTIDENMSVAQGIYVNKNGTPIKDKATGMNIPVPPETTTNYDANSGQLVMITKNRDGTISVQMKQVGTGSQTPKWTLDPATGKYYDANSSVNPNAQVSGAQQVIQPTPEMVKSLSPRLQGNNVQCGEVSNDYAAQFFPGAPRMGDSYESKVGTIQAIGVSPIPQVGSLFAMKVMGSPYGHTGIVQSVSADGKYVTVTDANKENNANGGPVTTSTFPVTSNMTFSVAPQAMQKQGQTTTYTPTEEAWANSIMNKTAKISDITNKDGVNKGRILELINQKSGGTTGNMQTNLQSGLEIVNSLLKHPGFTDVVGVPSVLTNPLGYSLPGTSARDFKAELKRMESIGFLNMIPQMQGMGALSNAEGSRLASAYSKLADTGISEEDYKVELERLKTGMETALKNMGVMTEEAPAEQPKTTIDTSKRIDNIKAIMAGQQ